MNNMKELHKAIEEEQIFWNSIFENKLRKIKEREGNFSSFWDEDYYKKITDLGCQISILAPLLKRGL